MLNATEQATDTMPKRHKSDWERDADARLRDFEVQDKKAAELAEHLKKSPFTGKGGFTQFGDKKLEALRRVALENPPAMAIFLFLTEHMSQTNAVMCSYSLLQKITSKSRSTVARSVAYLKEAQFIGVKKVGGSAVFHLNAAVVWHSYGENIKYAELHAPILLDPGENPDMKIEEGRVNVITQLELKY